MAINLFAPGVKCGCGCDLFDWGINASFSLSDVSGVSSGVVDLSRPLLYVWTSFE